MDKININISVTLDEAKEVMGDRSNGGLTSISAGKGGRAWIDGEWCLAELEALCVVVRAEAGESASGIMETLKCWEDIQIDPCHELPTVAKENPQWVEVPLIKFKSVLTLESTGERILHSQITGSQMEETALLRALEKFKAKGHISCEHGFPEKDPNGTHNDYVKRVSGVRLDRAVGVLDASTVKYQAPTETEPGYVTAMVRPAGPFKDQLEFSKLSTDSIPHFGMRAFSNDHFTGDVHVKEITDIVTFDLISK